MKDKEMIGARIQEIRKKRGMTQDQLSEKVGINVKYLSGIERGRENPTIEVLIKLAASLKADLADIFGSLEVEDPTRRKALISALLDEASDEQLKIAYKILSAIIR